VSFVGVRFKSSLLMSFLITDEPLEVIGSGTFGLIRKVKRISDGKIFARKELQFDRMTDRDRKQIVAEVNILRGLQHENIVKYEERFIDRENQWVSLMMLKLASLADNQSASSQNPVHRHGVL
jgi:serine/threonine protein kinase